MEGHDETEPAQRLVALAIVNRGFSRHETTPLKIPGGPYSPIPSRYAPSAQADDPWETLQWWESPWQARAGIKMLARRPFVHLGRSDMAQRELLVPARMLYPYALRTSEDNRIERAAGTIAAVVRQAREMYTAAQAAGVTDLGRPLLYFYGALALAKAATAALFGADALERTHGLGTERAPTISDNEPGWPTLIEWQGRGHFPMLYRAARWDDLYACCYPDSRWHGRPALDPPLRFHILECIRALQYPWGTLPSTGLAAPGTSLFDAQMRPGLLLPYRDRADMYMTRETPIATLLVQVPRVVVQYMLLYYFSILARYHPAEWQRLLAADREPEGYIFRVVAERVAHDYADEIARLLPNTPRSWSFAPEEWAADRPALDDWFTPPSEVVGTTAQVHFPVYSLGEWEGEPRDPCTKAVQIERRSAHADEEPPQA